ncbi:hypothetical protein SCHPADRAFT_906378 [Schizopora paradoxa]|uniref:Uncharacterized protein n=1 Tax=Schizopora paradoxa TaxID=27342 RepID=A0A0H2S246_9AGAM|nr:hypothetical protein SCHPADRAFT_906378 [Schizopora paradoxa]
MNATDETTITIVLRLLLASCLISFRLSTVSDSISSRLFVQIFILFPIPFYRAERATERPTRRTGRVTWYCDLQEGDFEILKSSKRANWATTARSFLSIRARTRAF